jgi:hypothetical protein
LADAQKEVAFLYYVISATFDFSFTHCYNRH